MSAPTHEDELLDLLREVARTSCDEAPSPRIEASLLEVFQHRGPDVRKGASVGRLGAVPRWRPGVAACLAVAASLVFALGAATAWWRSAWPGAGAESARAAQSEAQTRPGDSMLPPQAPGDTDAEVRPARQPARSAGAAGGSRLALPPRPPATPRFVAWPGAETLPSFESGQLVRTELPSSVLSLLGLEERRAPRGVVLAEVIVGQDRMPRAVRIVK